ncbi:MAG: bifunctional aldolase/short-chain dehydrogenase [Myxococcota bacterium]|jgi:rhamnose utilization protein RhaD (predicted bifunctional aldolase and dehydrogenase)/NAD(P)-dependent dehydrogenase (short-subunit alcohol dehydrogenase family)|nr:bifunctional aldolase/short-chain dehydrogenase [Myxococcota bacterium]
MKSRWSDDEARAFVARYASLPNSNEDVALRVYTSRLIGSEAALVLHGGGNTSVKTSLVDDAGELADVLCVKGSGWDLDAIEPAGLPAVRLDGLRKLRARPAMDDEAMVNAQRTRLLDASAPNPSVETLLHAFLAPKFVDHSHADAILALVDQPNAEALAREVFGDTFAIVPYVMPGFALAKLAAEVHEAHPRVSGLLLLKHGLFTFGDTARESYERHVDAVTLAERFVQKHRATVVPRATKPKLDASTILPILRGALAKTRPTVLHLRTSDAIEAYLGREDLADVSQRGTPTPDHVIRTKRVPMVLALDASMDDAAIAREVEAKLDAYRAAYREYVATESAAKNRTVKSLDPDPRVILIPGLGVVSAGASPKEASIAADLHEHLIDVVEMAETIGRYEVLPLGDVFDMEYWSLEQAKLGKSAADPADSGNKPSPKPLDGRVVIVTGAASGIGAATARRFAAAGTQLALFDRDEAKLAEVATPLKAQAIALDLTDAVAVTRAVDDVVRRFGGVDGLVSNAGIAPQGAMHEVDDATVRASFEVNFFAHQSLAAAVTKVLRRQGAGGFLLFNASKAAFDPGPGFGPYAAAKAALIALMKLYAAEQGAHGIRSNAINADRIRTALLPPDFVAQRAAARGLDADAYFRSNLLKREVTADDVAEAFLFLALAKSTTGCTVTVDGGNPSASPR